MNILNHHQRASLEATKKEKKTALICDNFLRIVPSHSSTYEKLVDLVVSCSPQDLKDRGIHFCAISSQSDAIQLTTYPKPSFVNFSSLSRSCVCASLKVTGIFQLLLTICPDGVPVDCPIANAETILLHCQVFEREKSPGWIRI